MSEKINQLQMLEQNLQQILAQKQQIQMQQMEIDSALTELKKTETAYKIVGNIMVASPKEDLMKDLESKKEVVDIKIKTIEKQEEKLKEKASNFRTEVMEGMEKK